MADDFIREYRINGRESLDDAQTRWNLHLKPVFVGMKAIEVTSDRVARYVDGRQQEGASNATINREVAALKRMFRLGQQSTPAKVIRMPYFPHLRENNVRKGFLEDSQYRAWSRMRTFGFARWWSVGVRSAGASLNWWE